MSQADERALTRADRGALRIAMVADRLDHSVAAMLTVVAVIAHGRWGRCPATGRVGAVSFDARTARPSADVRCRCGQDVVAEPARPVSASLLVRDPRLGIGARGYLSRTRRWLGLDHAVTVRVEQHVSDAALVTWFVGHDVHLAGPALALISPTVTLAASAGVPSVVASAERPSAPRWIRTTPVRTDTLPDGSARMHIEIAATVAAVIEHAADADAHAALDTNIRTPP